MHRRTFLSVLGLLASPRAASAQQAGKVYRVGFLGNSTATLEANLVGPSRDGLRDLGYVKVTDGGQVSQSNIWPRRPAGLERSSWRNA
jgi:hypothetical protein